MSECEKIGRTELVEQASVWVAYSFQSTSSNTRLTLVLGHVGAPLACNMMKVVDVPEMGYFAKENKGEVSFLLEGLQRICHLLMKNCSHPCNQHFVNEKKKSVEESKKFQMVNKNTKVCFYIFLLVPGNLRGFGTTLVDL